MAISKSSHSASRFSTNATVAGMKRPRTVRFCTTVKHVFDTKRADNASTWYSNVELAAIKKAIRSDLHSLYAGEMLIDEESNYFSWRGLESYTHRNSKFQKHRKERRAFLTSGVKDLQQRLQAENLPTGEAIRKLVTIASKPAVQEAQKLAARDFDDANQIYLETFLLPTIGTDKLNTPATACIPPAVAHDGLPAPHQQQLVMARTA